jgi:hypothetical protein
VAAKKGKKTKGTSAKKLRGKFAQNDRKLFRKTRGETSRRGI